MAGGKRAAVRIEADLTLAYPGLNPFLLSYEEKVGLWLDRDRANWVQVWRLVQGLGWAGHRGELPRQLFEAAADTPEDADRLEYDTNKRRGR